METKAERESSRTEKEKKETTKRKPERKAGSQTSLEKKEKRKNRDRKKINGESSALEETQPLLASDYQEEPNSHYKIQQRLLRNLSKRTTPKPVSNLDVFSLMLWLTVGYVFTLTALYSMIEFGKDGAREGLKIENHTAQRSVGFGFWLATATLASFAFLQIIYGFAKTARTSIEDRAYRNIRRVAQFGIDTLILLLLVIPAGLVSAYTSFMVYFKKSILTITAFSDSIFTNYYFTKKFLDDVTTKLKQLPDKPVEKHTLLINTLDLVEKNLKRYSQDEQQEFVHWFSEFKDAGKSLISDEILHPGAGIERFTRIIQLAIKIQQKYFHTAEEQEKFIKLLTDTHGYISKYTMPQHLIRLLKAAPSLFITIILVLGIMLTMQRIGRDIPDEMYDQFMVPFIVAGFKLIPSIYSAYCSLIVNMVQNGMAGKTLLKLIKLLKNKETWKNLAASGNFTIVSSVLLSAITILFSLFNGAGNLGLALMNPLVQNARTSIATIENFIQALSSALGGIGLSIIGFYGVFFGFIWNLASKLEWRKLLFSTTPEQLKEQFAGLTQQQKSRATAVMRDYVEEVLEILKENLTKNDKQTNYELANILAEKCDKIYVQFNQADLEEPHAAAPHEEEISSPTQPSPTTSAEEIYLEVEKLMEKVEQIVTASSTQAQESNAEKLMNQIKTNGFFATFFAEMLNEQSINKENKSSQTRSLSL